MKTTKQYDFSSLNDFFNNSETPQQLADEIVQLLFNYASLVDEYTINQFRKDVGTLFVIHNELINIE